MERKGEILTHVTQKDIELLKTNPNRFWRGIKEIGYRDGKHGKFGLTGAFCCADIENIEIPEGVNSIGLCAFAKCDKLKDFIAHMYLKCAISRCYNYPIYTKHLS